MAGFVEYRMENENEEELVRIGGREWKGEDLLAAAR